VNVNSLGIRGARRRILISSLFLAGGLAAGVAAWLTSLTDVALTLLATALAVALVFVLHKIESH
jgi:hypothetical protein